MVTDWKLARIRKTMLGYEDHGILTFSIDLEYVEPGFGIGSTGQGFGNFCMDRHVDKKDPEYIGRRRGTEFGCDLIVGLLWSVGVDKWEDLMGQFVWVQSEHTQVHRIMGIKTNNILDPKEVAMLYDREKK